MKPEQVAEAEKHAKAWQAAHPKKTCDLPEFLYQRK
jgi:hypothetical protein